MSKRKPRESYFIGGRQYVPAESYLLCTHETSPNPKAMFDLGRTIEELYCTKKSGTYYKITRAPGSKANVTIISEKAAVDFMDQHNGGIVQQNYISLFGTPEVD